MELAKHAIPVVKLAPMIHFVQLAQWATSMEQMDILVSAMPVQLAVRYALTVQLVQLAQLVIKYLVVLV